MDVLGRLDGGYDEIELVERGFVPLSHLFVLAYRQPEGRLVVFLIAVHPRLLLLNLHHFLGSFCFSFT